MLALPAYVIGNSVSQAFYGEAAKQMNTNPHELKTLFLNTVKKLTLISLPIFGSIALLAPFVFPIIFGESWRGAGLYALPLAIVALSKFISNPTNNLAIYGFNKWLFVFQSFRFILILIGFYISYIFNLDILLSLLLYSCIVASTYFILIYLNILAIDKLIANQSATSKIVFQLSFFRSENNCQSRVYVPRALAIPIPPFAVANPIDRLCTIERKQVHENSCHFLIFQYGPKFRKYNKKCRRRCFGETGMNGSSNPNHGNY